MVFAFTFRKLKSPQIDQSTKEPLGMAKQQGRPVPIPLEVNLFEQLCCHMEGKGCR